MKSELIDFRPFDFRTRLLPGSVNAVIGARGTGKTTVIKELMFHLRHYQMGLIFVGTEDTAAEYAEHFPDSMIYADFDGNVLMSMVNKQGEKIARRRQLGLKPYHNIPHRFVIIDDLMFDPKTINNDPAMRRLMMNGRHYKTTIIIALQYAVQLSKSFRMQVDNVFATFEKSENRFQLFEFFDVGFGDRSTFDAIFTGLTTNYRVMVMDRRENRSRHLHDSVFYMKAKRKRSFRMGHRSLWKQHDKNYNRGYVLGRLPESSSATIVSGQRNIIDKTNAKKRSRELIIRCVKPKRRVRRRYDPAIVEI